MTRKIHCPSCGCGMLLCLHCNMPVGEDWCSCVWCGKSLVGEPEAPKLLPAPEPTKVLWEAPKQQPSPKRPKAAKAKPKKTTRQHGNRRWKITRPVQVHRDEHRWIREQAQATGKGHKEIISKFVAEWVEHPSPPVHDAPLLKNDQAMLNVGLATDEAADWYRGLPNKRAVVRGIIRRAMKGVNV